MKLPTPITTEFLDDYEIQHLPIVSRLPKYCDYSAYIDGANFDLDALLENTAPPHVLDKALLLANFYTPQGILDETYTLYLEDLKTTWEETSFDYDPVEVYNSLFLDYSIVHPQTTYYIDYLEIYAVILGSTHPYTIRQFIWAFASLAHEENYALAPLLLVACCNLLSKFFFAPDTIVDTEADTEELPSAKSIFFFRCMKVLALTLEDTFLRNSVLQQQQCRYLIQFIAPHIPHMKYGAPLMFTCLTLTSIHLIASSQYVEELARIWMDKDYGLVHQTTTHPLYGAEGPPELRKHLLEMDKERKTISALHLLIYFHPNYFMKYGLSVNIPLLLRAIVGFQMNIVNPFDDEYDSVVSRAVRCHAPLHMKSLFCV